jgi:hypothetical protein
MTASRTPEDTPRLHGVRRQLSGPGPPETPEWSSLADAAGKMCCVNVDQGWQFVSIGFEGQPVVVAGVNLWEVTWTATGGHITVAHPQYPSQRHQMSIYEVTDSDSPINFAAGEFSNGVWGFYVPG